MNFLLDLTSRKMMRLACAGMVIASCVLAGAPKKLRRDRTIVENEQNAYILVVNVAGALDQETLDLALSHCRRFVNSPIETSSIEDSFIQDLTAEPIAVRKHFGNDVILAVFLENDDDKYTFIQAPRAWSMVNFSRFDNDSPTEETRIERAKKMLLKGIVHAAGGGANPDPRCVMWHGSYTLEGMDSTSATLGPFAASSLMYALHSLTLRNLPENPDGQH